MTNESAKLEIIKVLPPIPPPLSAWACERTSVKMHISESRLVIGPSIYCLQVCMCAFFNPEILQAGAVKRLRSTCGGECNYSTRRLVSSATLDARQEDEDQATPTPDDYRHMSHKVVLGRNTLSVWKTQRSMDTAMGPWSRAFSQALMLWRRPAADNQIYQYH